MQIKKKYENPQPRHKIENKLEQISNNKTTE